MAEAPTIVLCPYCGRVQKIGSERCEKCGGYFDDLSRRVSQQHMGPWFVRDSAHPFRPGCSYDVLVRQVMRGKIEPNTIIRGPTTRQFWSVARNVPGVAHLLGYCPNCGQHVSPKAPQCPQCRTLFTAPDIRDQLGLDPLDPRVLEEAAAAAAAQSGAAPSPSSQGTARSSPPPARPAARPPAATVSAARATVVSTHSTSHYSPAASPPNAPLNPPASSPAAAWVDSAFDSGADSFNESAAQPVAPNPRPSNLLFWFLVMINVLLFVAVIAYLLLDLMQ